MGGVDASQYFLELAGDRPTRQERLPDRRPTATTAFVSGWHIMDAGLFGHEAVRLLGGRSSSNRLIHGISVIFRASPVAPRPIRAPGGRRPQFRLKHYGPAITPALRVGPPRHRSSPTA